MIDRITVDKILDAANIVDVVGDFIELKKRGDSIAHVCVVPRSDDEEEQENPEINNVPTPESHQQEQVIVVDEQQPTEVNMTESNLENNNPQGEFNFDV